MDLHISVIADFKETCPDIQVVDWCLSGHAWVMKRRQDTPKVINPSTWIGLNMDMIKAFQSEYDDFLSSFDGFVCGHPNGFAMIYEKYNKPIVLLNSCRYDMPFCFSKNTQMLALYHESLHRIHSRKNLIIVSNNKADKEYLRLGSSLVSMHLPSLCTYLNVNWCGSSSNQFLVYSGEDLIPVHPQLVKRSTLGTFEWDVFHTFRAIVHVPYEISTMSIFEHYTMGIPLFFPTKEFLRELIDQKRWSIQSTSAYWGGSFPDALALPHTDTNFWIDNADFYDQTWMKGVYYYSSFADLHAQLATFTDPLFNERKEWIRQRNALVKDTWRSILPRSHPVFTKIMINK